VVAGKTINTFFVFFCSGGFFKRLNIMAESQFETRALRCAALRCAALRRFWALAIAIFY
jgi:hypothetical protein